VIDPSTPTIATGPPPHIVRRLFRDPLFIVGLVMLLVVILVALLAPWLAPFNPYQPVRIRAEDIFAAPSPAHLLGTNDGGQDVLSALLYGARTSLYVGFVAGFITLVVGGGVGLISGYVGGRIGSGLIRFADILLVIPDLALLIVVVSLVGQNLQTIVIVIGLIYWTRMARVVRAEVLSVRQRPFVLRARLVGASDLRILRHHILPFVAPLVLANTVLMISFSILVESALTFIGLGDPTVVSWGQMLNFAFNRGALSAGAWWAFALPGLAIVWLVFSTILIGIAVESQLDPRPKRHHLVSERHSVRRDRPRDGIEPQPGLPIPPPQLPPPDQPAAGTPVPASAALTLNPDG
jgi:peptide/nickel transport system permease protein